MVHYAKPDFLSDRARVVKHQRRDRAVLLGAAPGHAYPALAALRALQGRYEALQAEGRLVKDGVNVKVLAPKGPLDSRTLSKLPLSMLGD